MSECAVCLGAVRAPTTIEDCRHTFCRDCLADWFRRSDLCPTCKVFALRVSFDGATSLCRFATFTAARLPPTTYEPHARDVASEFEYLVNRLKALSPQLAFYRQQAFYPYLEERIYCASHRLQSACERAKAGGALRREERSALAEGHELVDVLEEGLTREGLPRLARFIEEIGGD